MNWLTYAITTAVLYGIFDFLIKLSAGKIDDTLISIATSGIALIIASSYALFQKVSGAEFHVTRQGLIYAIVAGVVTGGFALTFPKVFSSGANIVMGVSIVRIGMIIVSLVLGFILLKQEIKFTQGIGLVMAVVGLGLLLRG